jgi:hypothetical protein
MGNESITFSDRIRPSRIDTTSRHVRPAGKIELLKM